MAFVAGDFRSYPWPMPARSFAFHLIILLPPLCYCYQASQLPRSSHNKYHYQTEPKTHFLSPWASYKNISFFFIPQPLDNQEELLLW
jgi:hypothetical protein